MISGHYTWLYWLPFATGEVLRQHSFQQRLSKLYIAVFGVLHKLSEISLQYQHVLKTRMLGSQFF